MWLVVIVLDKEGIDLKKIKTMLSYLLKTDMYIVSGHYSHLYVAL